MTTLLFVRLAGSMSQDRLEKFRGSLKLKKRGRLTDEKDAEFGYRYLRDEQDNWVVLSLWRDDDTHWHLRLSFLNEPVPPDVIERCRADILAAADRHGFTLEAVWP